MTELSPAVRRLADAYGIATEFWDWRGRHILVPEHTIIMVLAALDVDASSPEAAEHALDEHSNAPWRRLLPPSVVIRRGDAAEIQVHVRDGAPVSLWVDLESGGSRSDVHQVENWNPPRSLDGRTIGEASFRLPGDLPLGYHTLRAWSVGETAEAALIVTPPWVGLPERMGGLRAYGVATQLYSVRSAQSWGVGDVVDLEDLAVWAGAEHGAGFVLVNPLHAAEPVPPMEPSPYLPTTRRFQNPLYLRVERIPEFADLDDAARAEIAALREHLRARTGRDRPHRPGCRLDGETHCAAARPRGSAVGRTGDRLPGLSAPRGRWPRATSRRGAR